MSVQICKNEYFYDLWGQISGGQSVMNVTMGIIEKKMVFLRTSNGNIIEFGMMYSGVKHMLIFSQFTPTSI
jgi:hypothetical protein